MTGSMHKLGLGDGYTYLTRNVASGDVQLTRGESLQNYYQMTGNPAGQWLGKGLDNLDDGRGIAAGTVVDEGAMQAIYRDGCDPITGEALGRAWHDLTPAQERIKEAVAALDPTLSHDDRVLAEHKIHSKYRKAPEPTVGFDFVLSVPKSVSTLWATAPAADRQRIHELHEEATKRSVSYMEKNHLRVRTGANGVLKTPAEGAIVAAFDHWDSRAGDPHLHTHAVVSSKAKSALTGAWLSIDSRALHRAAVSVGKFYDATLFSLVADEFDLGVTTIERERRAPRHEIDGVPMELMDRFSQRSHQISGNV
jgi:hypothetical protein